MRHFRDEVAVTQNTVIDGHAFRGDGLDSLGKQLVRQTLIHYFEYTLAIDRLLEGIKLEADRLIIDGKSDVRGRER